MKRSNLLPVLLLAALLTWLVGYPLLMTLIEALGGPGHWSLGAFGEFFGRRDEWIALWRSLWISAASVVLAAVVGVPLAFLFERTEFPGRRVLGAIVALPVALPPLVGVIAFLFLYGESGFASRAVQAAFGLSQPPWRLVGPGAILLVHAYSMYVYFYLFTRAGLARLDAALLEAAASLGADRWRTLFRVTLPLLRPVLAGASLLTFMTALASFSAPYLFGGSFRVMTTQIVASKLNGEVALSQVETVMLSLLALLGLGAMRWADRATATGTGVRGIAPARRQLRSPLARGLAGLAGWLLAAFLLLPHAVLVLVSLVPPNTWTTELIPPVLNAASWVALFTQAEQWRPVVNSLWMASAATLAAIVLGLAAARFALARGGRLGGILEGLIAIPWAVPGTVFAVALATTFSANQPWLGRFVLVGTPWILPLAYLVRSLPLTGRALLAGLRQLDPALEEAAASLGADRWRRLGRVVLPLLRPAIAAGAGLAFITALGDFVVSVVLYTFDTRPISMAIFSHLRDDFGLAAAYGVLLMIASTAAFLLWGQGETSG
ncbi:MAG: iron(III) transport system permease protein [Acidobacteriota bacterium]|jgi:iron(III) transport system permease protein|nr:iron(III) transport system permease protein [Acidobacteriota bacterium]